MNYVGLMNVGPVGGCQKPVGHFSHLNSSLYCASQASQSEVPCKMQVGHCNCAESKWLVGIPTSFPVQISKCIPIPLHDMPNSNALLLPLYTAMPPFEA